MLKIRDEDKAFLLVLALLAGSVFGVFAEANSQRPTPCLVEYESAPPNQQPQTSKQNLAVIGPSASRAYQRECEQEPSADWWMIYLTGAIALIGFGQLLMFYRQLGAMRQGVVDAAKAASAAAKQAKIAQDTFEKVERPYIYAFGASRLETGTGDDAFMPFVRYSVANYGRIPATIENVIVELGPSATGLPEPGLNADNGHDLLRNRICAPSERRDDIHEPLPAGIDHDVTANGEIVPRLGANEDLFLRIQIFYRGPFTEGHETSACWRLDDLDNRFTQAGLPQLNYVR